MSWGLHNRVVLLRAGPVSFATFGLLCGLGGALAAWFWTARQLDAGLDPERMAWIAYLLVPLLVVAGSRLLALALEWRALLAAPLETLRRTSFAFQGGLLLALVVGIAVGIAQGLPVLPILDTFALAVPLGHTFGRVGCFAHGCCHGAPARRGPAVTYTNPESKAVRVSGLGGVRLHPVQLYSAAGNLLVFLVLNMCAPAAQRAGAIMAAYLIVDSAGRFLLELLRWPSAGRALCLTPFQWLSLLLLAAGLVLLAAPLPPLAQQFHALWDLGPALAGAAAHAGYFALVFLVLAGCFGIQGRKVGSL